MGHHNYHFSDREAAQNWAENYGGIFHDNMHSRGDDSGTNFTVRGSYCDDLTPYPTVFIHGTIVFFDDGRVGHVQGTTECKFIQVIIPNKWDKDRGYTGDFNTEDVDLENNTLSFRPDAFTQDPEFRTYYKYI